MSTIKDLEQAKERIVKLEDALAKVLHCLSQSAQQSARLSTKTQIAYDEGFVLLYDLNPGSDMRLNDVLASQTEVGKRIQRSNWSWL